MQLIVNQQPCEFASDALDVQTLLDSKGVMQDAVAIAVNGEVVPRRHWPSLTLSDGDRVDLVKVVAGGAWEDDELSNHAQDGHVSPAKARKKTRTRS